MTEAQLAQRESKHDAAVALLRGLAAECRQTAPQAFPAVSPGEIAGRSRPLR